MPTVRPSSLAILTICEPNAQFNSVSLACIASSPCSPIRRADYGDNALSTKNFTPTALLFPLPQDKLHTEGHRQNPPIPDMRSSPEAAVQRCSLFSPTADGPSRTRNGIPRSSHTRLAHAPIGINRDALKSDLLMPAKNRVPRRYALVAKPADSIPALTQSSSSCGVPPLPPAPPTSSPSL